MKTYKVFFLAFATMILGAFVLTSCSNEENNINEPSHTTFRMGGDNEDDYLKVETTDFRIKDENYEMIIADLERVEISTPILDFNLAKVYSYNFTHIKLYEIPFKNAEKSYGAYVFQGKIYSFVFLNENNNLIVEDFNQRKLILIEFSDDTITDIDDQGGFISDVQVAFSSSQCDCHGTDSLCNHRYDRMENCSKYDYKECMICADDVCDQDVRCRYARTWTGHFYVLGAAVAGAVGN